MEGSPDHIRLLMVGDAVAVEGPSGAGMPYDPACTLRPHDVLGLPPDHLASMVAEVEVVLVVWSARAGAVLVAVRQAAGRIGRPVFALCKANEADQAAALLTGADGVLRWPLRLVLLEARLRAYRRLADQQQPRPRPARYGVGSLELDRSARLAWVAGLPLAVTPREFDLLDYLMSRAGTCRSRDEIIDQVWGAAWTAGTNMLDVHVCQLRRKLRARGVGHLIETVRGVGYRCVAPPAA